VLLFCTPQCTLQCQDLRKYLLGNLGGIAILGVKILVHQFLNGRVLYQEIPGSLLTRILTFKVRRPSAFLLLISLKPKGAIAVTAADVELLFLQLDGKAVNFLVLEIFRDVKLQQP
jgi:hypothetical protein